LEARERIDGWQGHVPMVMPRTCSNLASRGCAPPQVVETRSARFCYSWYGANCCDRGVAITKRQSRALTQALQLDLDAIDVCRACLSFVAFPLEAGDDREVHRALAYITPHLWAEGLEQPATSALEQARRR